MCCRPQQLYHLHYKADADPGTHKLREHKARFHTFLEAVTNGLEKPATGGHPHYILIILLMYVIFPVDCSTTSYIQSELVLQQVIKWAICRLELQLMVHETEPIKEYSIGI